MRRPGPTLPPHELEIMKVVGSRGHATVRDVYEALLEERRIAYTTVMTMMNVLEKKGHLRKKAGGRSFLYRPPPPQRQVVGSMVREFVQRVFGGSAAPLLAHLVDEEGLPAAEPDALPERLRGEGLGAPASPPAGGACGPPLPPPPPPPRRPRPRRGRHAPRRPSCGPRQPPASSSS